MEVNPRIFREYDIRGVVDTDLTGRVVEHLGRAFGTLLPGTIAVGGDIRLSTEAYRKSLIKGILSSGTNVIDIGIVPTPVFYFAIHRLKLDGGVQITASHNPPQYNGFKICKGTDAIYGGEVKKILELVRNEDYSSGKGALERREIIPEYADFLREAFSFEREILTAVDCGNGCAGIVIPKVFGSQGIPFRGLYCEPDGSFPNHFPDPTVPANLEELIRLVRRDNLAAGLAYDGDADRLGVVDDTGRIVWADEFMVLFYREVLAKNPGALCPIEVKCSQSLWEEVERLGGRPEFCRTGHSLIKARMKETGAPFCGEMSGHIFFADEYFGFDDAVYASLRLIRILAKTEERLSDILKSVPRYHNTPEIRVDCPEEYKEEVVAGLADKFRASYPCIEVDGVRVLFGDGWGLVRKSNTSAKLILRFEARSRARLQQIQDIFIRELKGYPQVDTSPILQQA